jgi:hypothetical protein
MSKHLLKSILKCMIVIFFIGQFIGITAEN